MKKRSASNGLLPLLALSLVHMHCEPCNPTPTPTPDMGSSLPGPGQSVAPRVETPALDGEKERPTLKVDAAALPQGARAHFPAQDGDSFFVSLPAAEQGALTGEEVAKRTLEPILKAVGFGRGLAALRLPKDGVAMPKANLAGAAAGVNFEYAANERLRRQNSQRMLDAMLGKIPADAALDAAFETGEGMNFAQYKADIERQVIHYPFHQMEGDVPIEHALVVASRTEGQSVTSVWGTLLSNYTVGNASRLTPPQAFAAALENLGKVKGVQSLDRNKQPLDGPYLMLLPYGDDGRGGVLLRYAYRMLLRGRVQGDDATLIVWIDAEDGQVRKLDTLYADVAARGPVYNRDPGVGVITGSFDVNGASAGRYLLALDGVMSRVDYRADGYNDSDVSISDSGNGSSAALANFDQSPINDAAQAQCGGGTNKGLQQVNFFATIHRYYQGVMANGMFTPFPPTPWNPRVDIAGYCNANASMAYGSCQAYSDAACPSYSAGGWDNRNFNNFAQDNTVVGHELAHNITWRLNVGRPGNWCGVTPCAIPVSLLSSMHDLADAWADHFESTNCTGGWVGKDQQGAGAARNCARHDEDGYLPRLHEVAVPFNPTAVGDHFPEHRALATGEYSNGQIGAAALWQVRLGMRSKCRPSGTPQYAVRFQRALRETAFFGTAPANTDLGIYRYFYDLEVKMVDQWASAGSPGGPPAFRHNGPHTANKVVSGFARAGLFLLPPQCLDGSASTTDPTACPGGASGADAVVDIDDNEAGDDLTVNGVTQPERDFLRVGGPAPTFHVWTGPRYRLSGAGGARSFDNPAPCNSQFQVEVATDPSFPAASLISSGFITVDVDPSTAASPECYGTWTPSAAQWSALQAAGARFYYRARTRDAAGGSERLSTAPGAGLWTVPPPYAVITADGRSDY